MSWNLLENEAGSAAWNMALDEALLLHADQNRLPVLRFYSWYEPAATFGYFQAYQQIATWTPLRPLIRRPTGGGLVAHDADWTYSLVSPPGHWWYELRAEESYRLLHTWIRDAFAALNFETVLAPCCSKELPGRCFAGPEKFDLVYEGKKIAGAAQRRNKHGLLIQGSIQSPPAGANRRDWEKAMVICGRNHLKGEPQAFIVSDQLKSTAKDLERSKYATDGYNQKK